MRAARPIVFVASFGACVAAGCGAGAPAPAAAAAPGFAPAVAQAAAGGGSPAATRARLLALLRAFEEDERALTSFLPVAADELFAQERTLLDAYAADLATVRDEELDADGRVDLHLIRNDLARTRTRIDWDEADLRRAAPLLPFLPALLALERDARFCGVAPPRGAHDSGAQPARRLDGKAIAARLDDVARLARGVREPADAAARTATAAVREDALAVRAALRRTRESQAFLDAWTRRDPPADPDLAFWVATPAKAASAALGELAQWLEGDVLEGLKHDASHNAFAIGRERYVAELRFEGIDLSPEEMLAFGETQLKALQDEIRSETVRALQADGNAPADPAAVTWQAGLELEKADSVAVGEQKLFVYDVACEAVRFCREQRLFPVPPLADACWRLQLSDLDTQKSYAYGFYGGNFMGVASPLAEMDSVRKLECLRSNARPTTRTVVPHELIPGHHLQGWFARRSAPWRDRFGSPFYGEGWAVHCERTFDEHGFFATPVARIGHLFWRLLRAARIVVSTKYHLNEMSAPQMVDFMVENAGLERSAAQAEVDRYMTYSPLYQCAYLYGCEQIRDLREECRKAWGDQFSELRFNTELLEQGSIPLRFAREALLATR
jgi:uncharacterized protein (DUF885 family)